MKNIFLTSLFISLVSLFGWSQHPDLSKLNDYFDALEAHHKFMGSVAVARNGEIIYSRSLGFSDVENEVKADDQTVYRIGSISKTFTAVLVMKSVEQGKLRLEETLDSFFPSVPNAEKITIEHLLRHRSGIHNFTDDAEYLKWYNQPRTEDQMVAIITNGGSDFAPDSQSSYSNPNYILLTYILEKRWGKSYAALIEEFISRPLGLTRTYFGAKINTLKKEARSYHYQGVWKAEMETDTSVPMGAGGIVSTPKELVKFSDALFSGKLLKAESLERMKTIKDEFGIGLFQIPFYDRTAYGHTGGIDGFSSVFSHFEGDHISYALISNGTNMNPNDISIAVLSAVYGKDFDIPAFSSYVPDDGELDQCTGVYASTDLPLVITITQENGILIAQATGQPSFPLDAADKDRYSFEPAGVVMEFNRADKTMVLLQGGGRFVFRKK